MKDCVCMCMCATDYRGTGTWREVHSFEKILVVSLRDKRGTMRHDKAFARKD